MTDCHPPPLLCGQSQRSEEGIDCSCWPCQSCVRRRKCRVSRRSCLRHTLQNRIQNSFSTLVHVATSSTKSTAALLLFFSLTPSQINHVQSLNAPKLLRFCLRCLHSSQNTTSLRVAVVRMQYVVVHTNGPPSASHRERIRSPKRAFVSPPRASCCCGPSALPAPCNLWFSAMADNVPDDHLDWNHAAVCD